jgi:hypothetical protein
LKVGVRIAVFHWRVRQFLQAYAQRESLTHSHRGA